MPWHPPIPFGALYSKDAIKIGQAIALLGYCYDNVDRDGSVRLSLRQAATDMGVSYATIKRWWEALRSTEYIADYSDHRRGGLIIQIADTWLDWWREDRYEIGSQMSHKGGKSPKNSSNSEPISENIVQKSSKKGLKSEPSHNAYKVLSDSDQAESEDRDGTARTLAHPAVEMYLRAFPTIRLNQKQAASITALVGDGVERLECWQEVIHDYELSTHWKPENVGNMKNRFENKLRERRAKDTRPTLPVVQPSKPIDTVPPTEIARRLLAARNTT